MATFHRFGTEFHGTNIVYFKLDLTNLRNEPESIARFLCITLALNLSLQIQVQLLVLTLFVTDLTFCCDRSLWPILRSICGMKFAFWGNIYAMPCPPCCDALAHMFWLYFCAVRGNQVFRSDTRIKCVLWPTLRLISLKWSKKAQDPENTLLKVKINREENLWNTFSTEQASLGSSSLSSNFQLSI